MFRQIIQDKHLNEAERILPLYHNVLFEGFATGYYELGLPVDDVYLLQPEATSTPGIFTRSRSSSAASSTVFSDTSSIVVRSFTCHLADDLTLAVDRRRGSILGGSVFDISV